MSHITSFQGLALQQSSLPDTGRFCCMDPRAFHERMMKPCACSAGWWWLVPLLACIAPFLPPQCPQGCLCCALAFGGGGQAVTPYRWPLQKPLFVVAGLAAVRGLLYLCCDGRLHGLSCCRLAKSSKLKEVQGTHLGTSVVFM